MRKTIAICVLVLGLWLLTGCSGNKAERLRQLEALEQQNRSGEPMLNDSLAESLVDYFDRHGDANERMRSHYILGRTYYCLGELPRALEIYNEAADCADTTSADCEYKVLSRIHAQSAVIFNHQVQPRSQLMELRLAERFAWKGKDTIQAVECYAQQANAYELLNMPDSMVEIKEAAAHMYSNLGRPNMSARTLAGTIATLVIKENLSKAKSYIELFESSSGLFSPKGDIEEGREIYYYIKGKYYLAIGNKDSAEYLFRKGLREGKDLNSKIAGCKGLQEVFEQQKNVDSIAKYSTLAYVLNDSAYSLAEMQNIQQFQASYNYNHNKFLAEQKRLEAKIAWLTLVLIVFIVLIIIFFFGRRYFEFRKAALDHRLKISGITCRLKTLANANPPEHASFSDWKQLRELVEHEVPSFRKLLKVDELPLSDMEYDVCLAIRVGLQPQEISKLKKCSPSLISKTRKSLLMKVFQQTGNSEDFDDKIVKIRG